MKFWFRFRLLWILLLVFSLRVPVYANNLIGDENGIAIGSTAVTAKVEMPEEEDIPDAEDGLINTGDDNEIAKYIFMILLSAIVIVFVLEKCQEIKY